MTISESVLSHLFMESHSADRAQLLDESSHYILWLTLSHHEVADTHTHTKVKKKNMMSAVSWVES